MNRLRGEWTLDREKFMSESEVKQLRKAVKDKATTDLARGRTTWPRFWMVINLAVNTGMRVSELANLQLDRLYLNSDEPRIRVTGKGGRTRDIYISHGLMEHLSEYLSWKRCLDEPMGKKDYLFWSSQADGAYSTRGLQHAFKVSAREAGLPSYHSIHSCRHSVGFALYKKTKDLRLVQKILGHASVTTTAIYTAVTVDELVTAAEGLFNETTMMNGTLDE